MRQPIGLARPKKAPKRNGSDRKPKAARWLELLDAAAEIFYEKGYDATSLQDIADSVGILKGSIYYYIETKQDLLDQLLREVHAAGMLNFEKFDAIEANPLEILRQMVEQHVLYICDNLARTTVYLNELGKLSPEDRKAIVGEHEFRNKFMDVIVQAQDGGLILADLNPKLAAQVLLSSINSVYGWYHPDRGQSAQAVAAHVGLTNLRGLATEAGLKMLSSREASAGNNKANKSRATA